MLEQKIKNKTAKIGVIGLGYVGLPLCLQFTKKGFDVLGIDIKKERVKLVNQGKSYIEDASQQELKEAVESGNLSATWDYDKIQECDVIQICVPTPVNVNKEPNTIYITDTTREISKRLRKEQLIILKSTTFPETTEKVILPILEKSGFKVGKDFYLAFSPERIDPGNKEYTIENTPVIVGGVTKKCTHLAKLLYISVMQRVIAVSSSGIAEMTKLLENTFRNVNIALVNELAQLCERMKIDIWEVIDAASTKPFGFMSFYPGPGVGGHCIPIDPYYLSWKAREYDFHTSFIELSAKVNENMPYFVVDKVIQALSERNICPSGARVLMLGVAFKRDVNDQRDSPALKVMGILKQRVKEVIYNDPYIEKIKGTGEKSIPLTESLLKKVDCVLITTDHRVYDYKRIVKNAKLVVDTRNATKGLKKKNVVRIGC